MKNELLIPFLNKTFKGFHIPTLYLAENVKIEKITLEDHGLIFSQARDEYKALISPSMKCLKIEDFCPTNIIKDSQNEGVKISYILNHFKKASAISLSFAIYFTIKRKKKITNIINLDVCPESHIAKKLTYELDSQISKETIKDFYKVLCKVLTSNNEHLYLTLSRYNAAHIRQNLYDRIIDITISLESLINGTNELRYKFALYNSWTSESDPKKRKDTFNKLTNLYDVRSAIVHGANLSRKEIRKKVENIEKNWENIFNIASKSIAYFVLYLYKNNLNSWYNHQKSLVLKVEERIA